MQNGNTSENACYIAYSKSKWKNAQTTLRCAWYSRHSVSAVSSNSRSSRRHIKDDAQCFLSQSLTVSHEVRVGLCFGGDSWFAESTIFSHSGQGRLALELFLI